MDEIQLQYITLLIHIGSESVPGEYNTFAEGKHSFEVASPEYNSSGARSLIIGNQSTLQHLVTLPTNGNTTLAPIQCLFAF